MKRHAVMVRVVLTLLVLVVVTLGSGPGARADKDQVTERATITYRLDRQHARIRVTARVRWTNQIPSTAFRRYYLEQWGPIAIPVVAKSLKVTGRGVRAQRFPTGGSFDNVIVSFPRIYRGQSVSFTATWTLPSAGPESTADVRVTNAYSYFCWTGQPVDSGTVTVIVPRALEAVTRGARVRTSRDGSSRRISARGSLGTFYACTDIYDPRLLVRHDVVSPGGRVVAVEGWSGDGPWLDEATTSVGVALDGLESVVGAPLPGGDPIRVREVAANALQGYGGEFDHASGIIRVGEAGASAQLLAHELAHLWFNESTLNTNWLWEGFAEWSAREALAAPCQPPSEYPVKGSPRLGRWRVIGAQAGLADQALVEYQYLAACSIMEQVSSAMGPAAMRQAIAVILAGDSPYDLLPVVILPDTPDPTTSPAASPGTSPTASPAASPGGQHIGPRPRTEPPPSSAPATPSSSPTPAPSQDATLAGRSVTASKGKRSKPVDWRQWLDIVDEAGLIPAGVPDPRLAERLLVTYGIARTSQLKGRNEARAAFHALQDMSPAGVTPAVVRRLMDDWEFGDARRTIRLAGDIATRLSSVPVGDITRAERWAEYERATSGRALERLRQAIDGS